MVPYGAVAKSIQLVSHYKFSMDQSLGGYGVVVFVVKSLRCIDIDTTPGAVAGTG
jgi:hypothetical protein